MTLWKPLHKFHCAVRGCHTYVGFMSEEKRNEFIEAHKTNCPNQGHTTTYGRRVSEMLVQKMWEKGDIALKYFLKDTRNEHLRGMLAGMCEIIYLVSTPYYDTVDDVKRELMTRNKYAHEHGGLEGHITPGAANVTLFPEERIVQYESGDGGYTQDPAAAAAPPVGFPAARVDAYRALATGRRSSHGPRKDPAVARDSRATGGARVTGTSHGASADSPRSGARAGASGPAGRFAPDVVDKIKAQAAAGFDVEILASLYDCKPLEIEAVLNG